MSLSRWQVERIRRSQPCHGCGAVNDENARVHTDLDGGRATVWCGQCPQQGPRNP